MLSTTNWNFPHHRCSWKSRHWKHLEQKNTVGTRSERSCLEALQNGSPAVFSLLRDWFHPISTGLSRLVIRGWIAIMSTSSFNTEHRIACYARCLATLDTYVIRADIFKLRLTVFAFNSHRMQGYRPLGARMNWRLQLKKSGKLCDKKS